MEEQGIFTERRGKVEIITVSNPGKKNVFTPPMRRELTEKLLQAGDDLEVGVIVLTGAKGEFCAGADITWAAKQKLPPKTLVQRRENTKDVHRLLPAIITNPKPVIAAVEGDAFGAGFAMAMAADFSIATPGTRFGAAFTKIGIYPELGMMHILPQRIGIKKARRILMLSEIIGGEEALEIGMVDELTDTGEAVNKAIEFAAEFENVSPLSLGFIKEGFAKITSVQEALASELDYMPWLSTTEDSAEGMSAVREKRKPVFKNR